MFGLGDNDDDQRLWNFMLFNVPMTDKEMADSNVGAAVIIIAIAAAVIFLIIAAAS